MNLSPVGFSVVDDSWERPLQYFATVIFGGLSFLVALVVNDALLAILNNYFPREESVTGYIIYALVVILIVFIIIYFGYKIFPRLFPSISSAK